jgi:eukaryotic-like serine/threonine-protein kinase
LATVGKIIKGKWRIDARLGSGATATVYAATHRNGYRVALKVLHVDLSRDKEIVARFLREGYVANTIQHKGVVRVLDDDVTEDGAVFLVLELLEGESLASMLTKNGGRLPWMQVADKMVELLDVLSTAHSQGVVHRDVKPDNVFLTTEGVLKVLDFGLARFSLADKESTRAGAILGTPDFMSPEQAAGKNDEVDARSDLYSVAATAYVLMSGQPLHVANTLQEHLQLTANAEVRSLAKAAPWVPFQLVGVVDRALQHDKTQRWSTAFEMQGALRAAVEEADVVLVPDAPTMLDPPLSEPPQDPRPNLIAPVKAEAPPSVHPPASKPVQARAQLFVPSSRPAQGASVMGSTPVSTPGSGRPPPAPPSAAQPALPAPPLSAALKSAAASSSSPEGEEEEELLQRPDAPTIFDPDPAGEDKQPVLPPKPLAAWTERLLEAEAAETAVSRGISPKSVPQNDQPKNELQKSTPVGPITRSPTHRRVPPPSASMSQPTPGPMMPGGVPAPPMGPTSVRMATKFEIDDTLQSPQAHLVKPTPQGPSASVRQIEIATPQPMHPQALQQPEQQQQQPQQQQPFVVPQAAPQTSSSIARIMFYGVLVLTAVLTYMVVRHITQAQKQPSAPSSASHAPAPPPPQPQTSLKPR